MKVKTRVYGFVDHIHVVESHEIHWGAISDAAISGNSPLPCRHLQCGSTFPTQCGKPTWGTDMLAAGSSGRHECSWQLQKKLCRDLEAVLNCLKCSLRWKIFIFFPLLQSDSTVIFLGRSGRNWSFSLSTQRPNRGQSNLFGLPRWAAGEELAPNLQTNNSKQLLRLQWGSLYTSAYFPFSRS